MTLDYSCQYWKRQNIKEPIFISPKHYDAEQISNNSLKLKYTDYGSVYMNSPCFDNIYIVIYLTC